MTGWISNVVAVATVTAGAFCTASPDGGVPLQPVTAEDLAANQDYPASPRFDLSKIQAQLDAWNNATDDSQTNER